MAPPSTGVPRTATLAVRSPARLTASASKGTRAPRSSGGNLGVKTPPPFVTVFLDTIPPPGHDRCTEGFGKVEGAPCVRAATSGTVDGGRTDWSATDSPCSGVGDSVGRTNDVTGGGVWH